MINKKTPLRRRSLFCIKETKICILRGTTLFDENSSAHASSVNEAPLSREDPFESTGLVGRSVENSGRRYISLAYRLAPTDGSLKSTADFVSLHRLWRYCTAKNAICQEENAKKSNFFRDFFRNILPAIRPCPPTLLFLFYFYISSILVSVFVSPPPVPRPPPPSAKAPKMQVFIPSASYRRPPLCPKIGKYTN